MIRLKDKRMRQVITGLALMVTGVLVWWATVYVPLRDRAGDLDGKLATLSLKDNQLQRKLKKLRDALKGDTKVDARLERLSQVIGAAGSIEEANAMIQIKVQHFLEQHDIQLQAYKELPPGKWQTYQVGRVEFRLSCTTQKLAELLQFLEKQEGAIRIERLQITSRVRKGGELRVLLWLGSLFVAEAAEKPPA